MSKVRNKTASAIKKISEVMANAAFESASMWGMHQPKEPKKIKTSSK